WRAESRPASRRGNQRSSRPSEAVRRPLPSERGARHDHAAPSQSSIRARARRDWRRCSRGTAMKHDGTRHFGKYRGTVVNTVDPELRARLQAIVPDVLGTQPTTWAMPAAPYAGPQAGFVALPPVGAGVWIEFEQGDPDFPIWTGGWWGSAGELPAATVQPSVNQITLVTPGKHA